MKKLLLLLLLISGFSASAQEMPSNDQDYINYNITKFGEQRKTGKFLQIAGAAGSIVGAVVGAPVVGAAAGLLTLSGFVVDVDASKWILGKNITKKPSLSSREEIRAFYSEQEKIEREWHKAFRESKKYQKYLEKSQGKSDKKKSRLYSNMYNNWRSFRYKLKK